MNLKSNNLSIRIIDYNSVLRRPKLVEKLRQLTLHPDSGMNYEMDQLSRLAKERPVNCQVLTAHRGGKIIGWALLSKESSSFLYPTWGQHYDAKMGTLFEIYVDPLHRKGGIGKKMFRIASRINPTTLCVCPWDIRSDSFYAKLAKPGRVINLTR